MDLCCFIPKMAAIPAAIVPMAIMNALGHKAVVDGFPQEQPAGMKPYLVLVTAIVPAILSLVSFYKKSKFAIRDESQLHKIHKGILDHHRSIARSSRDGISGGVTGVELNGGSGF